jgi:hypothetical protein
MRDGVRILFTFCKDRVESTLQRLRNEESKITYAIRVALLRVRNNNNFEAQYSVIPWNCVYTINHIHNQLWSTLEQKLYSQLRT